MPSLLSVVGRKGCGKSEALENLISGFTQRGYRVGVIKRLARDDFEIDQPGKDTHRYRVQGAETVILAGRKRLAVFSNLREEMPLEEILTHFRDFDLVLLEGYFSEDIPKLEVHRKALGERLLTEKVENVVAILSDDPTNGESPVFLFHQMDALISCIEEKLAPKGAGVSP